LTPPPDRANNATPHFGAARGELSRTARHFVVSLLQHRVGPVVKKSSNGLFYFEMFNSNHCLF
jgi:hypothetical protein